MKATNSSSTRWARAVLGGLFAVLMMLVFVAPADADIIANNRVQVGDTTVFPYSAIGEIVIAENDNSGKPLGACTGWLYESNMVATAGHCVYDATKVTGGWFDTTVMTFWPGVNGDYSDGSPNAPYGSCGVVASYASAQWQASQDPRFDYGALMLDCSVGNQTGVLNYGAAPTVGYTTRLCGYPDDKAVDTQWCSDDQVRAFDDYQVYYRNDTTHRMSGSPVMEWTSTGWNVVAIHAYGRYLQSNDYNHYTYNYGTRITDAVYTDLYNWYYG